MIRSVRNSVIRPSGVRSGVRTGVRELVTGSEGGVLQKSAMFCYIAHFPMLLRYGGLSPTTRPDRAAPAGTCRTGATPPFLPLVRQAGRGFVTVHVTYPVTPPWGRSRPIYPCGKAPIQNPKRSLPRRRQAL